MNRRIVIATAGSIAAAVGAGTLAFAMTVGMDPGRGPTTAAATSHPTSGSAGRRVVTVYVDDPPAATGDPASAPSEGAGTRHAPGVTGASEAADTHAHAHARAPGSGAAPVAHAPSTTAPHDDPVTTVPTTAAPTPTAAAPSCAGSDDGLTEAQKQAREAACHAAQHGGDD